MLPRANSAIEKKTNYPSVELPSPAPHCSRAQHPSQANHDRGWQPAGLLEGASPAPTVGQGAALSATLHPPEHHRAGPQSQLIPRGVTEASSPQGSPAPPRTHLTPKPQDHSWPSGSCHPSLVLSEENHKAPAPSPGQDGLGKIIVQLRQAPLPHPRAGWGLAGVRRDHSPSSHSRQDEAFGGGIGPSQHPTLLPPGYNEVLEGV